jgi:tetratricopeptide (TPR) repeat protein
VELATVPFHPQDDYQCGPAALASVLATTQSPVTPEALVDEVYLPARHGSLQAEMLATTRRHGRLAYPLAPRLTAVLQEVAAGNPVLVLQNLAFNFAPRWHYAVVVGYDRERGLLLLRSGRTRRLEISMVAFENTWERGGYWAMLALPPSRLPATADADTFVAAAVALERNDPAAAGAAYASALQRWPQNRLARLGLGNVAYRRGDLGAAAQAYREAAESDEGFADAWHNLAQVLYEQRDFGAARRAAGRAVAIGGPRAERYRQLQAEIDAAGAVSSDPQPASHPRHGISGK